MKECQQTVVNTYMYVPIHTKTFKCTQMYIHKFKYADLSCNYVIHTNTYLAPRISTRSLCELMDLQFVWEAGSVDNSLSAAMTVCNAAVPPEQAIQHSDLDNRQGSAQQTLLLTDGQGLAKRSAPLDRRGVPS